MTRLCCENFGKIARLLLRLAGNVKWQWGAFGQLALGFLGEKCFIIVELYGVDPRFSARMYTDAFGYAIRCYITQMQYLQGKSISRKIEVFIRYNSILLKGLERNYRTYKRKLLRIITFARKY
jgi:hypothetical protein